DPRQVGLDVQVGIGVGGDLQRDPGQAHGARARGQATELGALGEGWRTHATAPRGSLQGPATFGRHPPRPPVGGGSVPRPDPPETGPIGSADGAPSYKRDRTDRVGGRSRLLQQDQSVGSADGAASYNKTSPSGRLWERLHPPSEYPSVTEDPRRGNPSRRRGRGSIWPPGSDSLVSGRTTGVRVAGPRSRDPNERSEGPTTMTSI